MLVSSLVIEVGLAVKEKSRRWCGQVVRAAAWLHRRVVFAVVTTYVVSQCVLMRLLIRWSPAVRAKLVEKMEQATGHKVPKTDLVEAVKHEFCTGEMAKKMVAQKISDLFKKAAIHKPAPDTVVRSMGGVSTGLISGHQKLGRPLVINFGSCTCPIFMSYLDWFKQLGERHGRQADFLCVYTAEAHPSDGWAINQPISIKSHADMETRIQAARQLARLLPPSMRVVCDSMEGGCLDEDYASDPVRLCIVRDGILEYISAFGPFGYNLEQVDSWLQGSFTENK